MFSLARYGASLSVKAHSISSPLIRTFHHLESTAKMQTVEPKEFQVPVPWGHIAGENCHISFLVILLFLKYVHIKIKYVYLSTSICDIELTEIKSIKDLDL